MNAPVGLKDLVEISGVATQHKRTRGRVANGAETALKYWEEVALKAGMRDVAAELAAARKGLRVKLGELLKEAP